MIDDVCFAAESNNKRFKSGEQLLVLWNFRVVGGGRAASVLRRSIARAATDNRLARVSFRAERGAHPEVGALPLVNARLVPKVPRHLPIADTMATFVVLALSASCALTAPDRSSAMAISRQRRAEQAFVHDLRAAPLADTRTAAIAAIGPSTFAAPAALPQFSVDTTINADGFGLCQLYWLPADASQSQRLNVGRLTFALHTPDEAILELETILQKTAAELKNVDIKPELRGFGGGDELVKHMLDALWEHGGVDFVALHHLDRGSGKLISWYEEIGFLCASEFLPADMSLARQPSGKDLMLAPLELLHV